MLIAIPKPVKEERSTDRIALTWSCIFLFETKESQSDLNLDECTKKKLYKKNVDGI